MRILIADDDASCRLILRKSLEKLGHEVIVASDGAQAWELFQEAPTSVVISDWMMPGLDGLQLCEKVRSHDGPTYTYFLLLTALNDKKSVIKGLVGGADDYLVKPLDRAELEARLISATRVTDLHARLATQQAELARLNEELFDEGRRDALTRIGNRRRMHEDLEVLVGRAKRYGQGFCVALCDVDFFKKYNDSCGHSAGDDALKSVARTLATTSRSGDAAYRYGGEEFLVVLPEQTVENAMKAMDRRRQAVQDLAIPHPDRPEPAVVTVSAGLAQYDPDVDGESFAALLERADAALYRAKESGRNQVCAEATGPCVAVA